jgi:hypothetical protein
MVMHQHEPGSVVSQGFAHHLARIDAGMGLITLSAKEVFLREEASFCNSLPGN